MAGQNPVGTQVLPVNTKQTVTPYKANLDAAAAVYLRAAAPFAPRPNNTLAMNVCVDPGHLFNGATLTEVGAVALCTGFGAGNIITVDDPTGILNGMAATSPTTPGAIPATTTVTLVSGNSVTLSALTTLTSGSDTVQFSQVSATITAPVSNPRIDRVVGDCATGLISVVTGTAAASPVPPAIPAGKFPVARVKLQTTSTFVDQTMIWDERDFSALSPGAGGPAGEARNLLVTRTGNAAATVVADEVMVKSALGGQVFALSSVSLALNAATTGANGLDTGSLAASTFYYLYAIYNPTTNASACLLTLTVSGNGTLYGGAHMPSGYTMSALVGVLLTDAFSHFLVTTQQGREVFFQSAVSILSSVTGQASLTSQSVAAAAPPMAKTVSGFLVSGGTGSYSMAAAADSTGTGLQQGTTTGGTIASLSGVLNFRHLPMTAAQTVFWRTGITTASSTSMTVSSFTF